ncbi:MAG: phenylalanine--tRNA ligase subunit beta [bacterium]|nr:phenylalanine--tRNA ligase subunit beta [bacterium]
MLVPLSWLKEYVDISNIPIEELRKKMSSSGLAVERQHTVGEGINSIIIGEIINQAKHPDSDHLWVCQVNIGRSLADRDPNDEILQAVQIVTGAHNIFAGAKVPIILPGEVLPDGTKIESSKLRGYDSQGMMCSEKELGLGDNHEGIMILGEDAQVGDLLSTYLGLPDLVFDVEITANRGDLLSITGIAREVATLFGKTLKMPEMKQLDLAGEQKHTISAEILDAKKCSRFVAAVFDGFELKASPMWMQQRLLRSGMRPINNLVDITNYVMLELGQPTHAYDASQVKDHAFVARSAGVEEVLQTLDGKSFEMSDEMLVIADGDRALGIAGIMGGQSSKVSSETKTLILEAANFDPINVRRTGMKLNVRTDAIIRFERGVDPELAPIAMERIHYLLLELAGAHLSSNVVDVYPGQMQSGTATVGSRKLTTYIGQRISLSSAEVILNGLGFKTVKIEGDDEEWLLTVSVPSWRWRDISIEEDLIEEITRIYGYDNLPISSPVGRIPLIPANKNLLVKKTALELLKGRGFQEVLTYSFNSRDQIELSGYAIEKALEMANPLSEDQKYLRMSLLPSLLWTVEKNKHLNRNLHLYELSSVYHRNLYEVMPDEAVSLAFEPLYLSGVIAPTQYSFEESYECARTALSMLFEKLHIKEVKYLQDSETLRKLPSYSMFHPGRVGGISLDGVNVIGLYGEIHPKLQESLKLRQSNFMFDMVFGTIVENANLVTIYKPYSVFPETTEALSFIMPDGEAIGEIVSALNKIDARVVSIEVGKPYRGEQIEAGKQAITFTFVYQSTEGPIKEKDAEQIRSQIVALLSNSYHSSLRGI